MPRPRFAQCFVVQSTASSACRVCSLASVSRLVVVACCGFRRNLCACFETQFCLQTIAFCERVVCLCACVYLDLFPALPDSTYTSTVTRVTRLSPQGSKEDFASSKDPDLAVQVHCIIICRSLCSRTHVLCSGHLHRFCWDMHCMPVDDFSEQCLLSGVGVPVGSWRCTDRATTLGCRGSHVGEINGD